MAEEIKKGVKKIFERNKKEALLVMIGIIGIFMILISGTGSSEEKNTEKDKQIYDHCLEEDCLEDRLEKMISKIEGAGKTKVMVTFETSDEYFLAEDFIEEREEKSVSKEKETVITDNKNGEGPIIIKTKEAEIRGVLVICEGGGNPVVYERILEAVCALLDIPSNRVSVARMA